MPNPEHLMILTGTLTRVTHAEAPDANGFPDSEETEETVRCWLHQTSRDEETALANTQGQTADLYLPAGTDPTGLDRIEVQGVTWQFVGPPLPAINPRTGTESHVEATVRCTA